MKKRALLFACLTLCNSLTYAAAIQSMKQAQVVKALENKTITTVPLATLHGSLIPNAVTVYFGKDGEIAGQFANKPEHDPQSDQGHWQVKSNGEVCVSWKTWTSDQPICVYTYKLANSIMFINTDNKFESMVMSENIQAGNQVH